VDADPVRVQVPEQKKVVYLGEYTVPIRDPLVFQPDVAVVPAPHKCYGERDDNGLATADRDEGNVHGAPAQSNHSSAGSNAGPTTWRTRLSPPAGWRPPGGIIPACPGLTATRSPSSSSAALGPQSRM